MKCKKLRRQTCRQPVIDVPCYTFLNFKIRIAYFRRSLNIFIFMNFWITLAKFAYEDISSVIKAKLKVKLETRKLGLNPKRLPQPGELWISAGPRRLCVSDCKQFSYPPYAHDYSLMRVIEDRAIILVLEPPTLIRDVELTTNCYHLKFLYGDKVCCATMYFSFFPEKEPIYSLYPMDQLSSYEKIANILNG